MDPLGSLWLRITSAGADRCFRHVNVASWIGDYICSFHAAATEESGIFEYGINNEWNVRIIVFNLKTNYAVSQNVAAHQFVAFTMPLLVNSWFSK